MLESVTISEQAERRLAAWAATDEAVEAIGKVLDPGAWAHAEFVVSRSRARRSGRALLDVMLDAIK